MLNKLTIRNKLILALSTLVILAGLIFTIAFTRINAINASINGIMTGPVEQQQVIARIRWTIGIVVRTQKKIIAESDDQKMVELKRDMDSNIEILKNEIDKLVAMSSGELLIVGQEIQSKTEEFIKVNDDVTKLAMENSENVAKNLSFGKSYGEFSKAKSTLDELLAYSESQGSREQTKDVVMLRELFYKLFTNEMVLILSSSDETTREAVLKDALEVERGIEVLLTRLDRNASGDVKALLEKFNRQSITFNSVHSEVMELAYNGTNGKAGFISNGKSDVLAQNIGTLIAQYFDKVKLQLKSDNDQSNETYYSAVKIMTALIIASIVISTLVAIWLLRGISGSLNTATVAVKKVAAGDFSADVQINTEDEIGVMLKELQFMIEKLRSSVDVAKMVAKGDLRIDFKAQKNHGGDLDDALEQMVNNLRNIAATIYNGADNVTVASQQVAAASQQMSQGAQEQASSTEEVSSSMEQMAANIQQNTDNSRETEQIANKAASDIEASSRSVSETVEAITNIAERIVIIEEIASKTDLLALNAAVEAARAGEHGKGFAVVAAEVRKLAERSQKAAAEINEISGRTVKLAVESKDMLVATLPNIKKTAELVQEIAAASREQNAGAGQVNKAIQQLSQITQGNASAAEEMSSNAEELNSQSEELKSAISYFKLDDTIRSRSIAGATKKGRMNSAKTGIHLPKEGRRNGNGFELDMKDAPSDNEFTEF